MNEKLEKAKERLALAEALRDNDGWAKIIVPHLLERARHHAQGCRDRKKTPAERAEHIEAVYLAEELVSYLPSLISTLESDIRQIKEGKK